MGNHSKCIGRRSVRCARKAGSATICKRMSRGQTMTYKTILHGVTALVMLAAAGVASAEDGVTDTSITFGQAAAFEGPASALGIGMRAGIEAAFEEVNRDGGVHGRKLRLISENDGYEPGLAIEKTRKLISQDKVFALIGPVGTPTAKAAQPIATEANVPFIAPFTGAGFLRDPKLGNIVNIRATYGAETEAWIKHLVDDRGMKRIALLYQNDSFGRVGLDGVTAALERRGMSLVAARHYRRNTTAVKTALLDIRSEAPEAVVMVGAYKPIASFIKTARSIDFNPTFVTISFVGSAALQAELGADGEDVIISQVVPSPWNDGLPVVSAYQKAIVVADPEARPDFVSLEGYLAGRLTIEALKRLGSDVTRKGFLDTIWSTETFDLDGFSLTFGQEDNQGSDAVFLTRIDASGDFRGVVSEGW